MNENPSLIIGRMAALSTAVVTSILAISPVWELISPTPFPMNLGYVASMIIAVCLVVMMACLYKIAREELKIYGLLALVSSIIYAPICIGVYFLQLSIVASNPINLSSEVLEAINFKPGSPTFAIDIAGLFFYVCLL